jgi:hypothetical protein
MSAALLTRLAHLGVSVERAGDRLLLDGPYDALTEALIAEVAAAKPILLSMLGPDDGTNESTEAGAPIAADHEATGAKCPESPDGATHASVPPSVAQPRPWWCRCCGSGERRRRAEWGDWVCAFCRVIVAGPDQTEQPWQASRRYGPFPGTGSPSVVWGRERGYLAVRDPRTDDWHEIPYREAPPVWQAAIRTHRRPNDART